MTIAVKEILDRFDGLTEPEQREAAREILRRVPSGEKSTLSDDDLTSLAVKGGCSSCEDTRRPPKKNKKDDE